MTEPLYAYQQDAIQKIGADAPIYLGFDPGLGKSRTALEAAKARGASRILVICPASGRYVWEQEVRKWTKLNVKMVYKPGDLSGNGVFILTYGLISKAGSPFIRAVVSGEPYHMTVLDEAAALKNPKSNRTKAILGPMLPNLGYCLPLSGTPAPNHAGELYPILKALYPAAIRGSNGQMLFQWQFEDHFCHVVSKRFGNGQPVRVIEGSKNLHELRRRIAPFMLRVRKEEVLADLPPVRYDTVPLGVLPPQDLPHMPVFGSDDDLLKYLNGRGVDEHIMRLRRILGVCKVEPAIEYIDDFMQNLPDRRKILVFAHHKEVIAKLVRGLADWCPVSITGASTPAERTDAVNTFLYGARCRMFIGNIAASGTGLTLVGPTCNCSDVFFVEASYSVGDNVQAAARVHRIGQRDAVVARFLTAHGTIDDRIQSILARKARDFSQLFD